jgi:hypothetical protein
VAEQPFTGEDIQLVGQLVHQWKDGCEVEHGRLNDDDEDTARAILAALAEAGRLLPPNARIEWGIQRAGREPLNYYSRRGAAERDASGDPAITLIRRVVGPWVPVGAEETPRG